MGLGIKTDKKEQPVDPVAEKLWQILDDIDTLGDVVKPADAKGFEAFYHATMQRVKRRHRYLKSDGYRLYVP